MINSVNRKKMYGWYMLAIPVLVTIHDIIWHILGLCYGG